VSMYVCVLVDFIFCSYLMGSCQCFVAFLSSSLWIATACDCWLLEQNKTKWTNETNVVLSLISRKVWIRHCRRKQMPPRQLIIYAIESSWYSNLLPNEYLAVHAVQGIHWLRTRKRDLIKTTIHRRVSWQDQGLFGMQRPRDTWSKKEECILLQNLSSKARFACWELLQALPHLNKIPLVCQFVHYWLLCSIKDCCCY